MPGSTCATTSRARRPPGTWPSSPTGSLEERHAAEPLYALLRRAYELLDAGMAPGRVARWFEMHLLDELGVRPEVDRCVECDRVLESDERFRWVPPLGGVVCERCPGPPHDRTGLTPRGAQAAQGLPAPGYRGARRAAPADRRRARGRDRPARLRPPRPGARGALAGVPRRGPRDHLSGAGQDHRAMTGGARMHHHAESGQVHSRAARNIAGGYQFTPM